MNYKMLTKDHEKDPQIYAKIDDDGLVRVTCNGTNQEYLAWLAEGNEPLPADES
jgi:hypothetical protein